MNSFMYMRCAFRWITLYLSAKNTLDIKVPSEFKDKIKESALFLFNQLSLSGEVPNYGTNDGSHLFRFSNSNFYDFRPCISSILGVLDDVQIFKDNDEVFEDFLWWGGLTKTQNKTFTLPSANLFESGGYYTFKNSFIKISWRSHTYNERPAQPDLFHIDFWINDINLIVDSGTFSYNDNQGIGNYLSSGLGHNSIVINDQSQMIKISNFLWGKWPIVKNLIINKSFKDKFEFVFAVEHDGFVERFNIIYRRFIIVKGSKVLIIDQILNNIKSYKCSLTWRLNPNLTWNQVRNNLTCKEFEIQYSANGTLTSKVFMPKTKDLITASSPTYSLLKHGTSLYLESNDSDIFALSIGSKIEITNNKINWEGDSFSINELIRD